ncbi:MAG: carboxylesterase/lipase family protein [Gammaproteobacteria bacterium]|nr:carboxylesterase/lipase family protein [Gammaproteobacteria bacterium]
MAHDNREHPGDPEPAQAGTTTAQTTIDLTRRRTAQGLVVGGAAIAFGLMPALQPRAARAASEPVVETRHGRVRGFLAQGVYTFRGVRYGASTSAERRFRPPEPPTPWAGVVDASSYGFSAPQTNPLAAPGRTSPLADIMAASDGYRAAPAESEDCLFLNIWTAGLGVSRKRPVLVWLHGGGFTSGSASPLLYDGGNLVRRGDVVVVGINHRLNVFGYTHLEDLGGTEFAHSGNAGQLDIIQALAWVRDNIDRFGGDPRRVMIFGESGGGAKVSFLLGSPPAKGLFHRAVIESGPGLRMGERARASQVAEVLLGELGLSRSKLADIHKLSTTQILSAYFAAQAQVGAGGLGSGGFGPVLDAEVLPAHPFDPVASELSASIPIIIGWNRTEATVFSLGEPALFELNEAGLEQRVRTMYRDDAPAVLAAYRTAMPTATPSAIYFRVASEQMFGFNSILLAERKAALRKAPAYVYRFDWATPVMNGKLGSPHGVEMPFVFDNVDKAGSGLTGGGAAANRLAARVSAAWLAFAATGDPNTRRSGLPLWEPYSAERRSMMLFNDRSELALDPDQGIRETLAGIPG